MPTKAGPSAQSPTLVLPDLSFDDEGVYECEAYNSEGSDTYQGRIVVQGAPLSFFSQTHKARATKDGLRLLMKAVIYEDIAICPTRAETKTNRRSHKENMQTSHTKTIPKLPLTDK